MPIFSVRDTWLYERYIRPTVEWQAVYISYICAFICAISPRYLGVFPTLAYFSCFMFLFIGGYYHRAALNHWRFLMGLWKLDSFYVDPKKLPGTDNSIYMGRGFEWKAVHTQRLYELNNDQTNKYRNAPKMYYFVRSVSSGFKRLANLGILSIVMNYAANSLDKKSSWNPFPYYPIDLLDEHNTYGSPYLHGVEPKEIDLLFPFADGNSHTLVLGTTRQGKTRSAEIVVSQDIHRFKNSDQSCAVIMLDPKGDIELAARMFVEAQRTGKADKFYFFHLAYPHLSCRYNGIADYNRDTEVATRVTNPLSSGGNSQVFKDFAWQFINLAQKANSRMGKTMTYKTVAKYLKDPELLATEYTTKVIADDHLEAVIQNIADNINFKDLPPSERSKNPKSIALQKVLQDPPEALAQMILNDDVLKDLSEALKHDKSYYDKITASAKPHLEKLNTGKQSELISPDYDNLDDPRPIIDLRQIISDGCILYAGFDFQTDQVVGASVANTFLSEILAVSGEIYNFGIDNGLPRMKGDKRRKPMVRLHVDEANEIFGKEFNPILNKAGGSGVSVVAYTQTISDGAVRLESQDLSNQMLGNFGTIISFKVRGNDTSEYLSNLTPEVRVITDTPDSRATDGMGSGADGQFKSANADSASYETVRLIPEYAFRDLAKGQAFVYAQSRWYKTKLPLFYKEDDIPKDLSHMMREIEKQRGYSTSIDRGHVE
jgi:conjugative coupling factor TraD (TOL family)